MLRWVKNYLSGRIHRVKLYNQFSEWREMKGGIPQGSALGPLLFLIYMNNLPLQISDGLLVQYADDTTLICSGSTPSAAAAVLNSQLKLVHSWIRNSKMNLNYAKSSVMWFKTKSKKCSGYPNIIIHDTTLKPVDKQKYLGIMFDSKLSWIHQVSETCRKMSYYLHLISSHKHYLSTELIKLLVESLVFSHLCYCLPVWGPPLTQQLLQRLERMQNRAIRLCKNLSKFDHVSEYYRQLKWLPLRKLIQLHSARLMYCQYHRTKCIPLMPPIVFGPCQSRYVTRAPAHFANSKKVPSYIFTKLFPFYSITMVE